MDRVLGSLYYFLARGCKTCCRKRAGQSRSPNTVACHLVVAQKSLEAEYCQDWFLEGWFLT